MLLLAFCCTRVPEPFAAGRPPASLAEAARMPLSDFFERMGLRQGTLILGFVLLYRLGDSMINSMTTPFLIQTGFTQTDVGVIQGGLGLFATIVGVVAGGAVMSTIGLNRSLWLFGALQAASNLAYLALAWTGKRYSMLIAAIVVENVCYGLATAALVAFVMSLCNPRFSATQYALLSSLIAVGRDVTGAPSGSLAAFAGWPVLFLISVVASAPGMVMLTRFAPWNERESAVNRVTQSAVQDRSSAGQ
jgi:PAT family beta-lactamase induction signal transducer AmpG